MGYTRWVKYNPKYESGDTTMTSLTFRQTAYAQETGRVIIALITLTHASLVEPIRISTDPTEKLSTPLLDIVYGTVSRGNQYIFLPIKLQIPSDTDEGSRKYDN